MKAIELTGLPPGAQVRGVLYADPKQTYELGDVLEVELPNGFMIDVGYQQSTDDPAFLVTAYFEWFGNKYAEVDVRLPGEIPECIRRIAATLAPLEKMRRGRSNSGQLTIN